MKPAIRPSRKPRPVVTPGTGPGRPFQPLRATYSGTSAMKANAGWPYFGNDSASSTPDTMANTDGAAEDTDTADRKFVTRLGLQRRVEQRFERAELLVVVGLRAANHLERLVAPVDMGNLARVLVGAGREFVGLEIVDQP